MDWKSAYHPKRKITIEDAADSIHDAVTMEEVLAYYAPATPVKQHRCPCPLHNGKDYNFSFTTHGYKCFVCGASGDVITFVKEVRELATRVDAMKQISSDFNLHLFDDDLQINSADLSRLREKQAQAKQLREAEEKWEQEYDKLVAEYAELDNIAMHCFQISARAKAKERMAYISYLIECHLSNKPKG